MKNPFDELELSPLASIDEITSELRDRAEDAGDDEKKVLRAAWEELTMHPRARLALALTTFPDGGAAPPRPPPRPPEPPVDEVTPGLFDLLPRPSVEAALTGKIPEPRGALPPVAEDRLAFGDAIDPNRRRDKP